MYGRMICCSTIRITGYKNQRIQRYEALFEGVKKPLASVWLGVSHGSGTNDE
jgi:hypothetical protein